MSAKLPERWSRIAWGFEWGRDWDWEKKVFQWSAERVVQPNSINGENSNTSGYKRRPHTWKRNAELGSVVTATDGYDWRATPDGRGEIHCGGRSLEPVLWTTRWQNNSGFVPVLRAVKATRLCGVRASKNGQFLQIRKSLLSASNQTF